MSRFTVALLALAIAAPALADNPAPTADAKPVKQKRVCRREAALGSSIPHSICHTVAEWSDIDRMNADAAQQTVANGHNGGH